MSVGAVVQATTDDRAPWGLALGMAALLTVTGVALAVLAWRGMRGRLRRNRIAGIRTSATLASDEAWFEAQRVGGPASVVGGLVQVLTAVLLLFRPSETWTSIIVLGGVGVSTLFVIWGAVRGHRAAVALAQESPG